MRESHAKCAKCVRLGRSALEHSNPALRQEQRKVSHPILRLHRTTFSSAFVATSMSHCMGSSLPSDSVDADMDQALIPLPYLHLKVHTEAMVLHYLAADDVGGRFSGCTKRVLVATF